MLGSIRQVHIRHYKSISEATVLLEPLTIFVGPNGAGKSNFLDALSFVRDAVADSVELAFKNRGGISAVRRRSGGHPTHIGIRLIVELPESTHADYAFEIAAEKGERFSIARERCVVTPFMGESHEFEVRRGEFVKPIPGIRPRVTPTRLALFSAAAVDEYAPLFAFLERMQFYSIVPSRLRDLQDPDPGEQLKPDGSNAAAVLKRIQDEAPELYRRICSLLQAAVPGLNSVEYHAIGRKETLRFRQDVGLKNPWTFEAQNVSDGTLRMLGLLLAVYQLGDVSTLGIEEPEATVHPALAEEILQILRDASATRQVIVTTHSPDLLDFPDVLDQEVRVVTSDDNATVIAPLAEVSRELVRERLYTTGELMRQNELHADIDEAGRLRQQLRLFGGRVDSAVLQGH